MAEIIFKRNNSLYTKLTNTDMYADDATFHKASNDPKVIQQQLQEDIGNINRSCEQNEMYINPKNTKVMLLGTEQRHKNRNSLRFLSMMTF